MKTNKIIKIIIHNKDLVGDCHSRILQSVYSRTPIYDLTG